MFKEENKKKLQTVFWIAAIIFYVVSTITLVSTLR
ncbi:hypothetical protein HNQ90_000124 [Algibacter amylolyticus]|nr:hypothetical protein [Algibacter amylolyticus]